MLVQVTVPPAYQRIADELRRRIATGALKPGDALPSVRAVSRRWKVAPGTAVQALKVLVREGVAEAVPRSGMRVVGAVERAPRQLSREKIIAAGIRMADKSGLQGLSVRALGDELRAPTMSLYRHIESRDHLISLMVDAALGEEPHPEVARLSWRSGLERIARHEWRMMRRHPWLARAVHVSRPGTEPNALRFADRMMEALSSTRLNAKERLNLHVLLHSFVQGLAVNVEAEAHAVRETGIDEEEYMRGNEPQFEALASSGQFPFFARMLREIPQEFELDLDALFELGLTALLDGSERWARVRSARPLKRRTG